MTPTLTDADREVLDRLAAEFLEFGHEDGWLGEAIALHFLAAGMERDHKDAERYRWVRTPGAEVELALASDSPDEMDAYIDAALAQEGK